MNAASIDGDIDGDSSELAHVLRDSRITMHTMMPGPFWFVNGSSTS